MMFKGVCRDALYTTLHACSPVCLFFNFLSHSSSKKKKKKKIFQFFEFHCGKEEPYTPRQEYHCFNQR
jgi:hypothetical protein